MMAAQELFHVFAVLLVLLVLVSSTSGRDTQLGDSDAVSRAELTLQGLFNYYWKNDPSHKQIKFLFACGQLGQMGTAKPSQCSCYSPSSCVNCYRWWTAIMMESVATYGIYMNTSNHSSLPDTIYSHSPYNAKWDAVATCTFVDDFLWYGIAYLRVYDWLADEKWLNTSLALYDWAWKYGWDEPCGGFYWSTCPGGTFKFNIEFVEAMHLAAKLAYTMPNETRYLNDSVRLWNWFFSFDDGYGLMSDEFLVSTGAIPFGCCNATSTKKRCHNSRSHDSIYSQGLLLSSAAYLYLSTGNKTYLATGMRAFEAVVANYSTAGVLRDEPRGFPTYSTVCDAYSDPGGDWYSFSGVFMLHLGYFTELLVKNESMPSDMLAKINSFVQNTSNAAWSKSIVWPPFNKSNACQPGSAPIDKKAKYPKFHWWWGQQVDYDSNNPADPGYYFHKSQLRCHTANGNDTQLWEGEVGSEDKCMQKCDRNKNCSKYLWQIYESSVPGTNCWIWSYNRSNHICDLSDYDWNVGIKRPEGYASCAGKCGSTEPQKLDHGVCYCDVNCSKHLDCCFDYAKQCRPNPPSCKGHCNKVEAQPLPNGGYCWCFSGCNPGFTGGNCCGDYKKVCNNLSLPTCLDGRSQGSALNLFLGHTAVSQAFKKAQNKQ